MARVLALAAAALLVIAVVPPARAAVAADARAAATAFAGPEALPAAPAAPFEAAVDFSASDRLSDVGVALAAIALLHLLGVGLKRAALRSLRPSVFTAGALAILMFTVVDPAFWQVARVRVDADGLTVVRYVVGDQHVRWADVAGIEVVAGRPFPVFTDLRGLRLVDATGHAVVVPRHVQGAAAVAAFAAERLAGAPTGPAPPHAEAAP